MSIILENLVKRYGSQGVLNHIYLEIADGDFFVLLGPSGSGKTTILNIIAGLVEAEQGRVILNGRDVMGLPPQERHVGFVFQNYGLFQYMTVSKNIEFGLTVQKVGAAERKKRRDELLEMVGLAGLGDRMPWQLSGGQQQRIALARALAPNPEVLLLDEPLGALDAKIRTELRRTLRNIQQELKVTTILVTHDQEEAFDLADRIGVMNDGRVVEVNTPDELYKHPRTEFVASFLGTANLLVGKATNESVWIGNKNFQPSIPIDKSSTGGRVQILFRPEDVALSPQKETLDCQMMDQGIVVEKSFAGSYERLKVELPGYSGVRPLSPPVQFGQKTIQVAVSRAPHEARAFPLKCGDSTWVGLRHMHILPHPGLAFLLIMDELKSENPAFDLGINIAKAANARLTIMIRDITEEDSKAAIQTLKKQLKDDFGSLEIIASEHQILAEIQKEILNRPYDVIILNHKKKRDIELAEQLLQIGTHHLLLVPHAQPVLKHALVCVLSGEPGKEDVIRNLAGFRHFLDQSNIYMRGKQPIHCGYPDRPSFLARTFQESFHLS